MSDNQSDNTEHWGPESVRAHQECADAINGPLTTESIRHELSAQEVAHRRVQAAEEAVYQAEDALIEAKMNLEKAKGRLWLITHQPTWKNIFRAGSAFAGNGGMANLYTLCMQNGYDGALIYGKIYRAGLPGEGMIDTGLREEDIA